MRYRFEDGELAIEVGKYTLMFAIPFPYEVHWDEPGSVILGISTSTHLTWYKGTEENEGHTRFEMYVLGFGFGISHLED